MSSSDIYIGVMSGTSLDAVDVAAVDFADGQAALIGANNTQWPTAMHERVRTFANGARLDAECLARLDSEIGEFLGACVNRLIDEASLSPHDVNAIGCHGQTVAHLPDPASATTLQLGDANRIAESTGITTINDFRRRDMAAGGQGAPLATAFHEAMLSGTSENRVVLNLGGIANITLLPRSGSAVVGFDTGPANCLMDIWARRHLGQDYDAGGRWAASGQVDSFLLHRMLSDRYFRENIPKSTGTQYFSATWLEHHLVEGASAAPADVQATLLALTRDSIAEAIERHAPDLDRVLVCGGGVHNSTLLKALHNRLGVPVESTIAYGIDPDWMEAMAFAWLAKRTMTGSPGNLPSVTGARGERILGAVHFA